MSSFKPSLIAALAIALVASPSVNAHGRLIQPAALVDNDVRVNANRPCGTNDVAGALANATPQQVTPGQAATFTWRIRNGDGAGPVTARVDTTGTGDSFDVPLTVTEQVPGQRGILSSARNQEAQFTVDIPASLQCNPTCLLQVTQPAGFGSCAPITTGAGGAAGGAKKAVGGAAKKQADGGAKKGAGKKAAGGAKKGKKAGKKGKKGGKRQVAAKGKKGKAKKGKGKGKKARGQGKKKGAGKKAAQQ
ncbi:hypothetical protein BCR44DRAFT_43419 [Catenaria anguillulae PL171]|uniref:Uncharacterized protein n=1 Tax=Catenaria anguillulae PL171 TaxID=765915 RepID=A0A1Y2H9I3_9FUNG|nr:hypothetical protein BCR44DRAFT_43419 [Catenaria anguillulae PL171]